ncbi:protein lin-52 homolog isoform X1 [Larimichthys crocea]|uniref:protein lin-52 homolog isoform X1 n=1 Tax=Larimichthys crocea TaxID=215358 RepID=UPI000F5E7318|nr:protein lin-52 homolog isoform X1 [Larimichthys crocea]
MRLFFEYFFIRFCPAHDVVVITAVCVPVLRYWTVIHCDDFETSLLSFEKLDRASPDLWPEQLPGVAEFAASCKNPITNSPPKWMAELESEDIEMLKELGSLTTANLMEKVKGLQNLAYQLGLEESREMTRGKFLNILERPKK